MSGRRCRGLTQIALLLAAMLPRASAAAAESCYDHAHVPASKRVVLVHNLVLLDETTVFDASQRQHIKEQLTGLLQEGSALELIYFSAFAQDRYTNPGPIFKVAAPLDDAARQTLRKNDVKDFDVCQTVARKRAGNALLAALEQYFQRGSANLARSDILGVLKDLADNVMPRVTARDKRIVLVSDMLENSDLASFYGKGQPREIKPGDELAHVRAKGMVSDLRHAKVYVIGAGVVPADPHAGPARTYRPTAVMGPLKAFWSAYFSEANAQLVGFGQPLLLSPIVEMER